MIRAQLSGLISVNGEKPKSPALVTRMRIGPSSLRTLAKASSTIGRSVTSAATPRAVTPSARRSSATRCAACSLRSSTATLWPRLPSSWHVASPMPEAPPVTTATRVIDSLHSVGLCAFIRRPPAGCGWSAGLTGEDQAVVHLVVVECVVVEHPRATVGEPRHTRSAGTGFARRRRPQAGHTGGLQQGVARR